MVSNVRIRRVVLREIAMPLKTPFLTAYGRETLRRLLIVEAAADGLTGYGEVSVLSAPYYTEETPETARHVLASFLIPIALQTDWRTPRELARAFATVRRHPMAKAGLEAAAWDLHAQVHGISLAQALGGTRTHIESGTVVGLVRDVDALLRTVEQRIAQGYRRIKLKIEPGWDYEPLKAVREAFPQVPLAADANGSYDVSRTDELKRLDSLSLTMLEQPFPPPDLLAHAQLQAKIATPLCLDESIESVHDAQLAVHLGSCRTINVKPARVGGSTAAAAIHDLARSHGIAVWCGGMLESGIGRAHCLAVASLPGFSLPADLSGSDQYWQEDIVEPPITARDGLIAVPRGAGLGLRVRTDLIERLTVWRQVFE